MLSSKKNGIKLEDRYKGSLVGLAVGDALGARVESLERDTFKVKDMPEDDHPELKPGFWTDDTSMALCLADSLIYCKGFSPNDQMYNYLKWLDRGYLSPFGYAYGIGSTTFDAINAFIDNPDDPYAGSTDPRSAGNGSLMRLAPIPLMYRLNLHLAEKYAVLGSSTTHRAKEAIDACRVYSHMIIRALNGGVKEKILNEDLSELDKLSPSIRNIIKGSYKKLSRKQVKSTGYVVDTLEAALWAFYNSKNFKHGILLAINLGGDTDTVGAVYGQLAGAYYGYNKIPKEWREIIAMKTTISDMALELLDLSLSVAYSE